MSSRTKTGCITCRIRRVKCDETKPHCLKCQTSKRVCDGYLAGSSAIPRRQLVEAVRQLSSITSVPQALGQTPPAALATRSPPSPQDSVYYDLFRRTTAPGSSTFYASDFWHRSLMRLAHSEPAIWHAAVSMGALHRRWESESHGSHDQALTFRAEKHYGKAMAYAKDLDSPVKVLTLSLALIASANMLGRWAEMQTHLLASLRIMAQHNDPRGCATDMRQLNETLARIDVQAMTYSDSQSPYPYEQTAIIVDLDNFIRGPPFDFQSFEQAASSIFALWRFYFLHDESFARGEMEQGPYLTKYDAFRRRMAEWESAMGRFERTQRHATAHETVKLSIRLYHSYLRLLVRATPVGPETRFDKYLGHFEYALRIAVALAQRLRDTKAPLVSLEPGLIIILFSISHRCRHSRVRHAAINLLKGLNRMEGMWRSDGTAAGTGKLVAVEEEGLQGCGVGSYVPAPIDNASATLTWRSWSSALLDIPSSLSWSDVPFVAEERRVKELRGASYFHERRFDLSFVLTPSDPGDVYGATRLETVYF